MHIRRSHCERRLHPMIFRMIADGLARSEGWGASIVRIQKRSLFALTLNTHLESDDDGRSKAAILVPLFR